MSRGARRSAPGIVDAEPAAPPAAASYVVALLELKHLATRGGVEVKISSRDTTWGSRRCAGGQRPRIQLTAAESTAFLRRDHSRGSVSLRKLVEFYFDSAAYTVAFHRRPTGGRHLEPRTWSPVPGWVSLVETEHRPDALDTCARPPPGVTTGAAHRTSRLVRVPSTHSTWGPGAAAHASGTYPTREAGTRSPYVPFRPRRVRVSLACHQQSADLGDLAHLVMLGLG